MLRLLRRSGPLAILLVGFATALIYAWPGYMSSDSAVQLTQARSHHYTDGHPPAMAALWTIVELVVRGPAGMLVIQNALFLGGLYLILRRHFSARGAAIAATAIFVFPPVFAPMGVIWKDCQMAGFLMMGVALVGGARPRLRWVGVALLAAAIAMRHNAAAAALPIFLVMGGRGWRRVLISLALWTLASASAFALNGALTRERDHAWSYSVGPADIVGVLRQSHHRYQDAELLRLLDGTPLASRDNLKSRAWRSYDPTLWWPALNGDERLFDWPATAAQRDAIARVWRTLVLAHPLAYLRHRLVVFDRLLGLGIDYDEQMVTNPIWHVHMDRDQIVEAEGEGVQSALGSALDWCARHVPIFRPFIYFAIALLVLLLARLRDPLALLASALVYELTFVPFAPSAEFRYSHWMIAATVTAVVILVKQRAGYKNRRSR